MTESDSSSNNLNNSKNQKRKLAPSFHKFSVPQNAFTKALNFLENNVAFCSLVIGLVFQLSYWVTNFLLDGIVIDATKAVVPLSFGTLVGYVFCKVIVMGIHQIKEYAVKEITAGIETSKQIQRVSIEGFARITDARDSSTGGHVQRIGYYSKIIALQLTNHPKYADYISERYAEDISIAASLHDIGKVGVTDKILNKDGGLTYDEFEVMKMHTIIGGDLMADLERKLPYTTFYTLGKEIAYHHHQKWDGTGYPNVLKMGDTHAFFVQDGVGNPLSGDDIPLCARIVAVADVYDALISKRIYKDAFSHEKARNIIVNDGGKHFDPDVVNAFLEIEDKIIEYALKNRT